MLSTRHFLRHFTSFRTLDPVTRVVTASDLKIRSLDVVMYETEKFLAATNGDGDGKEGDISHSALEKEMEKGGEKIEDFLPVGMRIEDI